ncbi:MAG: hypothetical protein U0531_16920 [Dehalococcoidia bacterium]
MGGTSTLTFDLANPNTALGLTECRLQRHFPIRRAGGGRPRRDKHLRRGVCSGGRATTVSLSGGALTASATCQVSVAVTATTPGAKANTSGAVTATESGPGGRHQPP